MLLCMVSEVNLFKVDVAILLAVSVEWKNKILNFKFKLASVL